MKTDPPPLIAHIIYALGTGGLENGLVNIINRIPLDRYRHAIVCLTSADDFAGRLEMPGVRIVTLNKRPGHDLTVYWRLWKVLRQLQPAIIHSRNLAALEMQLVGLTFRKARRIHGEHGRDIYDLDGTSRKYLFLRRALNPFIHRYTAVSEDLRAWLVDLVGIPERRVRQIYNGVDQEKFFPRSGARPTLAPPGFLPENALLIGTVGRLAEVKDQNSLLRAFAQLVSDQPALRRRLRLVLIGDGPLFASLQSSSAELGIADLVWMPGDRVDIPELLRMIDIFVLPSLAEGISNTILEAMASGLPVVATRTGGNPELIDDGGNGYLVPVSDPRALADTIAGMIADPERTVEMGACGREKVERRFNWGRTVEDYLSVYDEESAVGQRGGD
jgi:sugar transferase (PEP-CTERM/EpsH1 system associated)